MITIVCSPLQMREGKYGLLLGAWDDPDHQFLSGFASAYDAWDFAVSVVMENPLIGVPEKFRAWTYQPQQQPEITQLRLF